MRLPVEVPLPEQTSAHFLITLRERFRQIVAELNRRDVLESDDAPLFDGTPGQFVARKPASIVIAGTAGSRYTITGWRWLDSAWVEVRTLTGT